jgi:TPR repeat protein
MDESRYLIKQELYIVKYSATLEYIIPENELQQNKLDALGGDTKSSLTVAYHYVHVHGEAADNEKMQWFTIGAENNEPEIQYALANELINFSNNDFDSKTRGIFWLYKALKNGYKIKKIEVLPNQLRYNLAKRPPADRRFPYDYMHLSEERITDCRIGALQGNKKAALLLGKYYSEIALDKELSEYWYRIGAQNGNSECQYRLGQIMLERDNEHDQIRGKFWLEQTTQKR